MTKQDISALAQGQRDYFSTGITQDVHFRLEQLQKLYDAVQENEAAIQRALQEDLGKSGYEGFMCEIGLVLSEISYLICSGFGFFAAMTTSVVSSPSFLSISSSPLSNSSLI